MTLPSLTLILGGVSSGKSGYGEQIVNASGLSKVYLATAQAFDDEMLEKVANHVAERGPGWNTLEVPFDLAAALKNCTKTQVVLLDCATMWLTNLVMEDRDIESASQELLSALKDCACPVVVVSNELGLGGVPANALARRFARLQGRLNAQLAAQADTAVMVTAGIPTALKGTLHE